MRNLIEPLQQQVNTLAEQVSIGTINTASNQVLSYSEIVNILDNSQPEWSKSAYTTLKRTAG